MAMRNFIAYGATADNSVIQRTFSYVELSFHQPQPSIYLNDIPMIPHQYHMQQYSYPVLPPYYPYTLYSPSGGWINSSDQYRPSSYTTTFVDDAAIIDHVPPYTGFVNDGLLADDIMLDMGATNHVREYDHDLFEIDELMGTTSYEDLLEMGERVGRVNVGLSEETISKHLKTTRVDHNHNEEEEGAEIRVVCQDEYESNETVAILRCGHRYHADCIKEWLLQQNVCPICKSTALEF